MTKDQISKVRSLVGKTYLALYDYYSDNSYILQKIGGAYSKLCELRSKQLGSYPS